MTLQIDESRPVERARPEDIPVVDVAAMLAGDAAACERVDGQMREACSGLGFLFIAGHGIDPAVVERTFDASRLFHDLPVEEKMKVRMNRHQCGWMPPNVSVHNDTFERHATALKPHPSEAFKFTWDLAPDDPDYGANRRFRGHNKWPDPAAAPGVREAFLEFHAAFEALALKLLAPLARSLDLPPDWFDPHFARPSSMSRIAAYPPISDERARISTPGHTDLSFLTLIPPATIPGLEILTPDGVWIEQPVVPDAVLFNTGNTLRRWVNDRYLPAPHRVRADANETRYSNIFFLYPNVDAVIECAPTCHGPGNPPKYPPLTFGEIHADYARRNFAYAEDWD